MLVKFTKMHGLGNDFVVLDLISQNFSPTQSQIRFLADRHRGIGCDQILLVEPPSQPEMDFRYRIYNASGEEVEQCGNGARCFAKFVHDQKLSNKKQLTVETLGGPLQLNLQDDDQVMVDMGVPSFEPAEVPFQAEAPADSYTVAIGDQHVEFGALAIGNPHAVLLVDSVDTAPVETLGPILESHPRFPNRVNVGFLQIMNRNAAKLRVFERGVGETQACGSGACAAVASGIARGFLDNDVSVDLLGGKLRVSWAGPGEPIKMTGPATTVFEGKITL